MTNEANPYQRIVLEFEDGHETVKHCAKEFLRGDVSTDTVEGYFSVVKRSINGIYHSVSTKHLHGYLANYEFTYNGRKPKDGERTVAEILGSGGKRLP